MISFRQLPLRHETVTSRTTQLTIVKEHRAGNKIYQGKNQKRSQQKQSPIPPLTSMIPERNFLALELINTNLSSIAS